MRFLNFAFRDSDCLFESIYRFVISGSDIELGDSLVGDDIQRE